MQQEWDNLDTLIRESQPKINISQNYNSKLMYKLNNDNKSERQVNINIAAISFIMSGIMLIIANTTDLQYRLISFQSVIRNSFAFIQHLI